MKSSRLKDNYATSRLEGKGHLFKSRAGDTGHQIQAQDIDRADLDTDVRRIVRDRKAPDLRATSVSRIPSFIIIPPYLTSPKLRMPQEV